MFGNNYDPPRPYVLNPDDLARSVRIHAGIATLTQLRPHLSTANHCRDTSDGFARRKL